MDLIANINELHQYALSGEAERDRKRAEQAELSSQVSKRRESSSGGVHINAVVPTSDSTPDPTDEADQTIHVADTPTIESRREEGRTSSGLNLDEDVMIIDDNLAFTKSPSGSQRPSSTPSISNLPQSLSNQPHSPEDSALDVSQSAYQLPSDPAAKTGKLRNKYVMPDGTVVNGKGLGRGRPGIKRGPRRSTLSNEITGIADTESITVSTPSPAPQAQSNPAKRKRTDSFQRSEAGHIDLRDEDEDSSLTSGISRDSTPEYNPSAATQTRSGRQSQKPITIVTPSSSTKTTSKRPSLNQNLPSPVIKKHPKIKAKVYRGREQFALCEHCLRGNGPPGNVIVFCDACNKCWHQRCHEPKISKEVVADTKAEWFCSDCDRILHGKKKIKSALKITQTTTLPSTPVIPQANNGTTVPTPPAAAPNGTSKPQYGLPFIPGMALTLTQRKQYLDSLSKSKLIDIVLRAADLAPNMPIFETPLHQGPQQPTFFPPRSQFPFQTLPTSMRPPVPQGFPPPHPTNMASASSSKASNHGHTHAHAHTPTPSPASVLPASSHSQPQAQTQPAPAPALSQPSNIPVYTHPTAGTPSKPNTAPPPSSANANDDEGYFDDFDELALIYPKPGEGVYDLVLPPESSDLNMLLEGPDCRTFSHWVRGRGEMRTSVGVMAGGK